MNRLVIMKYLSWPSLVVLTCIWLQRINMLFYLTVKWFPCYLPIVNNHLNYSPAAYYRLMECLYNQFITISKLFIYIPVANFQHKRKRLPSAGLPFKTRKLLQQHLVALFRPTHNAQHSRPGTHYLMEAPITANSIFPTLWLVYGDILDTTISLSICCVGLEIFMFYESLR